VTQQGLPLLCYRYLTRKRSGEGGKREEGSRERGEGREGLDENPPPPPLEASLAPPPGPGLISAGGGGEGGWGADL